MRRILLFAAALAGGCASKSNGGGDGSSSTPTPAGRVLDRHTLAACTEVGCEDGLMIRVTPTSSWPAGAYTFTVEADGETTVCTGSLPLPPCENRAISCDKEGVQITESGCALDPAEHAFGDITFNWPPASVSVTVEHDGRSVGSQSWTPAYERVEPNGPGCPPTCNNATVEFPLSFP